MPPAAPFGITDCYIKPYPCCRHIQPAVEALIGLLNDEAIASEEVQRIDVATYRIAAEHAETGWDDFASAQLSFPYLMGLALKFRAVKFEHFSEQTRRDPAFGTIARKISVTAPADVDRLYPQLRPARVTVTTARGSFTRQADEALGSRIVPLDDAGLTATVVARRDQRRRGAGGVDGEAGVAGCVSPQRHPYFGNSASALARSICARRASERNPDS